MQPQFAIINGAACRYVLSGDGDTTIVLMHELGGSLNSWDGLVPLLPPHLRVLRYDLRGSGMSEKLRGTQRLDTLADDVRCLLDDLAVDGPVIALGAAVGAMIAAGFTTRYPDRVDRLVLVAPTFGVPPHRKNQATTMAAAVESDGTRAIAEMVLPDAFPEEFWSDRKRKDEAVARWLGADPEGYAATYRMLIDTDVHAELARIECPTLAIAATHDRFNPPDVVERAVAAIPDCSIDMIEGGHFLAVQSPDDLARAIADFLQI